MKDTHIILRSILKHLAKTGILLSRVSREALKDKAVVEFSFDLSVPPFILSSQEICFALTRK